MGRLHLQLNPKNEIIPQYLGEITKKITYFLENFIINQNKSLQAVLFKNFAVTFGTAEF